MNWITAITTNLIKWLLEKLGAAVMLWIKTQSRIKKRVTKNREAIKQLDEAETPEDYDNAAKAIGRRTDKS